MGRSCLVGVNKVKISNKRLKEIILEEIDSTIQDQELEAAEEQEWEELLFGTMQEMKMPSRLALGTILGLLAGKAIESTGVLGNFEPGSAARYEFIAATGLATGYMARSLLDYAGDKLEARARKEARRISVEMQKAIVLGLIEDKQFVALLENLTELSDKVEEIKGKRGKKFQAIRAERKQAAAALQDYINENALLKIPLKLRQQAGKKKVPVNIKKATMATRRKYFGVEDEPWN